MSVVGMIGAGVSIFGSIMAFNSQQEMIAKQTAISKRQENIRNQQMQLDAQRTKRAAIRQGLLQRATAVANGVSQGAGTRSSGVLSGAAGGVANALEGQETANASTILGTRMFGANMDYFNATQNGQFWTSLWSGIGQAGQTVLGNAGTIGALGQDMMAPKPVTGSAYTGGWGSAAFRK